MLFAQRPFPRFHDLFCQLQHLLLSTGLIVGDCKNTGHYSIVFAILMDTSKATISPLPLYIARIYTIVDKSLYFQNSADHRLQAKLTKTASTVINLSRALRKDSCLIYIGNGPSTDSPQNCEFFDYKATNGAEGAFRDGIIHDHCLRHLLCCSTESQAFWLVVAILTTCFHARLSPIILQIFKKA